MHTARLLTADPVQRSAPPPAVDHPASALQHILVHLDASGRAAERLAWAQRLATREGARLTAFYGVLPGLRARGWRGVGDLAAVAQHVEALDDEQRARARAQVALAAARGDQAVPLWADGGDTPYAALLAQAPYADLLVLGQADSGDVSTGPLPAQLVAGVLCDAGRPTLLLPHHGAAAELPDRVLVAWKPSRESARALAAALPWLRRARQLDLAVPASGPHQAFDHATALRQWLAWRGVAAPQRLHHLGPGDVGNELLRLTADSGAHLLVMGGYSHSRTREWIFGGTTRRVLQHMQVPVLMAH